MSEIIGQHFIVTGRVQGVCFRAFTKQEAIRLGLSGWVRNLPDGNVEASAFGTLEQLTTFADKLHEGPPQAQVATVLVKDIPLEPHVRFIIK